jgi:penicillin-binding protein 1A
MNMKKRKLWIRVIWGTACFPFVALFIMVILINLGVFGKMPAFEELENPKSELATEVYSEDGVMIGKFALKNRSHIEFKDISPHLTHALISTEDIRFIHHSGIDYRSLGRVLFKTVLGGDRRSGGGSTITQQLALNLFSERSSSSIRRAIQKMQEWITAVKLERNYTKTEIITMYFNTVAFGYESYGIQTAAQTYFSKLPSELNIEESALLVGIVNAPSLYNPRKHPERAKERRNTVLHKMEKAGYLTREACDSLCDRDIELNFRQTNHNTGQATYFREMLRQTLKMQKPDRENYRSKTVEEYLADSTRWADDPLYGWCNKNAVNGRPYNLDRDGLKIYTTINTRMQRYAEQAVAEHLSKTLQPQFYGIRKQRKHFPFANIIKTAAIDESIDRAMRNSDRFRFMKRAGYAESDIIKSFSDTVQMTVFTWNNKNYEIDTLMTPLDSIWYYKAIVRVAFMAMEPGTGKVRAYVGGPNFKYLKFDNVWQGRRQIGSTVKPFLYTLAMQYNMNPCDKVLNTRQYVEMPAGQEPWSPKSGSQYVGQAITLKLALAISSNNVSAWLIQRFPPSVLINKCREFGLTSHMDDVPSICLGSSDMSLYEMVPAYNTFPSQGIRINPYLVTHIEDKYGKILTTFTPDTEEVINKKTAYKTVALMKGVTSDGTGARVKNYISTPDVAGKTGTTDNNSDGWFIGYLPKLTAGVWVGNEDRGAYLLGDGARMALPVWGLFMKKVLADGTLGVSSSDRFELPADLDPAELSCYDSDATDFDSSDDLYF